MIKKIKQIFILSAASSLFTAADAKLILKLDQSVLGNIPMPITENVDYDILGQQISVTTKYPMICNQIEGSSIASHLTVAVNSPNKNTATSGVLGLMQSVDYNIGGGQVSFVSENLNKSLCMASTLHDVIFESNFTGGEWEQTYPNNFFFYGLEESKPVSTQFAIGTEYVNNSGMTQELDYIEFWPSSTDLEVFANSNGINCSILDNQNGFVANCPTDFSELGKYKGIMLAPGHKIVTTNNLVIHPDSEVGKNLYLMTAIFTKVNTIQSGGQNQSFSNIEFIEAQIKVAQTP